MTAHVLAIDLGGTIVKAGVVAADGTVLASARRPSREPEGVDAWIAGGLDVAVEALSQSPEPPEALGLSVPGAVDRDATHLVDLVDRMPSSGVALAPAFASLGLPVAADNDAKAALSAERRWGGMGHLTDVVVLTVGTGIGSAALVGGREPGGDRVLAGNQLGHLVLDIDGARCVCGNRGCAETMASATALVAAANHAGIDAADAAAVFDEHAAGDPRAAIVLERFVAALAATVVNAIHAYQPDVVVLTGGVLARADWLLPQLRERVAERAWTLPRGRVRVEASRLGPNAGVLAGAAVALEQVIGTGPAKCTNK